MNTWFWLLILTFAPFFLFGLIKLFQKMFKKNPNIAIISANGTISYGTRPGELFYDVSSLLGGVIRNRNYQAVILRVNSPGGTVGASQELYDLILHAREQGIKVVALMEDVAASGGLYLCMAADHVIAKSGTVTGSIGVIFQNYEYSGLLKWFELKPRTIKSGKYKDMMSPTRAMTEDELKLLQGISDNVHQQFQAAVAKGRGLSIDEVRAFGDGRVMSGEQALSCKLVSSCGCFTDALEVAMELAEIPNGAERVQYLQVRQPFSNTLSSLLKRSLFGRANAIKEALPGSNLPAVPLWLMPGFDL